MIAVVLGLVILGFVVLSYWMNIAHEPDVNRKVNVCNYESDGEGYEECMNGFFEDNSDVSVCESIEEEYRDYTCYKFVAINTNQPELCERSSYAISYCYTEVAVALKNSSICDFAEGWFYYKNSGDNKKFREYCLEEVEKVK